jgi:hypothetical protein
MRHSLRSREIQLGHLGVHSVLVVQVHEWPLGTPPTCAPDLTRPSNDRSPESHSLDDVNELVRPQALVKGCRHARKNADSPRGVVFTGSYFRLVTVYK